jgi:hypothetical protein
MCEAAMSISDTTIEYRDVPGWLGYRVGSDGSVWFAWINCRWGRRLTDRWKPMKIATHWKGYKYVNLTPAGGGKYKTFRVHRLVLEAFVGPCPEGMETRHLNGVRDDCRLNNLAWGTPDENRADIIAHEGYTNRRRNVRYSYQGETKCLKDWARHFGVPYSTLYQRINQLGMSFEEAITRPFLGVAGNGGRVRRR